jgi:hypothetical protein
VGYDQLFKKLLRKLLREFLELFFPAFAARLDFGTVEFPNKEVFKSFPDGMRREPDVVALVRTWEGDPEIVVVHIEAQSKTELDFGRRMFEYYSLLWLQFDAPVFPIVLYVKEGGRQGLSTAEYRRELFGREIVRFRYASVALARLSAQEYLGKGPLGTALSSLMRRRPDVDEVELQLRMLMQVLSSDLDEESEYLLVNLIKTSFPLPKEARARWQELISRKEYRKVQEVELTWGDRFLEQGREEGLERGRVEGRRDLLKRVLAARFGPLPTAVEARVDAITSAEELDRCAERAVVAGSLEELGLLD